MLTEARINSVYEEARTEWSAQVCARKCPNFTMIFAKKIEAAVIADKTEQLAAVGNALAEFVKEERGS